MESSINVLIGCSGSVASIKIPQLVNELVKKVDANGRHIHVRVVSTKVALHFFSLREMADLTGVHVYADEHEWQTWTKRGDPVLHIDLRNWADVLLLAPLSANTLAKLVHGLCDNLLTCVVRAWPLRQKPVLFAPAMNTAMYDNPLTAEHIAVLKMKFGFEEIPVISKRLMCNEVGMGAMAEVATIVQRLEQVCASLPSSHSPHHQ